MTSPPRIPNKGSEGQRAETASQWEYTNEPTYALHPAAATHPALPRTWLCECHRRLLGQMVDHITSVCLIIGPYRAVRPLRNA